jgi:transcriptional regulator with GAF, ATPase, and Fis domain
VKPIPETRLVFNELARFGDTETADLVLQMGRQAQEIVPECVGMSLALVAEGLAFTLVATDEEIAAVDALQYLDGGPCVLSAHDNRRVAFDQEATDEGAWQLFCRATAAAGIASSLTLPIESDGVVVGSVNLYGSTADAFDGRHEELSDALETSAAGAITNADLAFDTRQEAVRTPERLADQGDIDVALGIIAGSQQVDIATAQQRLVASAGQAGITEGQAARAIRSLLSQ